MKWAPPPAMKRDLLGQYAIAHLRSFRYLEELIDYYMLRGKLLVSGLVSETQATAPIPDGMIDKIRAPGSQPSKTPSQINRALVISDAIHHINCRIADATRHVRHVPTFPGQSWKVELHKLAMEAFHLRLVMFGMPKMQLMFWSINMDDLAHELQNKIMWASKLRGADKKEHLIVGPDYRHAFPWVSWRGGIRWHPGYYPPELPRDLRPREERS